MSQGVQFDLQSAKRIADAVRTVEARLSVGRYGRRAPDGVGEPCPVWVTYEDADGSGSGAGPIPRSARA